MNKRFGSTSEGLLSEESKKEIQKLRTCIFNVGEQIEIPNRYSIEKTELSEVKIKDSSTGCSTIIGLYSYSEFREVLSFIEDKEEIKLVKNDISYSLIDSKEQRKEITLCSLGCIVSGLKELHTPIQFNIFG